MKYRIVDENGKVYHPIARSDHHKPEYENHHYVELHFRVEHDPPVVLPTPQTEQELIEILKKFP